VQNPELALEPAYAVSILFDGMISGLYTGVGLAKYFNQITDWVNARRIVNGEDKKHEIAEYAQSFYAALQQQVLAPTPNADADTGNIAHYAQKPYPVPIEVEEKGKSAFLSGKKTHVGMLVSGVIGIAAMLGYIPGMTPDQGAAMLQTAFGVSGFRSALPKLIEFAVMTYVRSKV
jgi:hypothetical protein